MVQSDLLHISHLSGENRVLRKRISENEEAGGADLNPNPANLKSSLPVTDHLPACRQQQFCIVGLWMFVTHHHYSTSQQLHHWCLVVSSNELFTPAYGCMFVWVHVPICAHKGQRRMLDVLFCHSSYSSFETGSLGESGARLEINTSQWFFCLWSSLRWGYRCMCVYTLLFTWVTGIWTLAVTLVQQVPLPGEPPPSPRGCLAHLCNLESPMGCWRQAVQGY